MTEQLLPPGQVFAERYRVDRLLARGGFGAVYVAEQLATEALVALKVLWPHILGSEAAVASFQQEARISGRVKSEHIVSVVDAGFDKNTEMPFLVMELLDGQDLQRTVEHSGPLSPEMTVAVLRQVGSALDKAHGYVDRDGTQRPIVHRDLKPENLFLCRSESGSVKVKVLDFGIAKVMSATAKISREVKGTPLYMAHEQAGGGAITPQTDVWALGLIVFFLLTGRNYWRAAQSEDGALTQLFGEVLSLPIDPPSVRLREYGVLSSLPPAFDDWFLCCLNRDPSQRFQSAGAAVARLGQVLGVDVAPSSAYRPPMASASTVALDPASSPFSAPFPGSTSEPGLLGSSPHATPGPAAHIGLAPAPAGAIVATLESARPTAGARTAEGLAISAAGAATPTKRAPILAFALGGLGLLALLGGGAALLIGMGSTPGAPAVAEPTSPGATPPEPSAPVPVVAPAASPEPTAEKPETVVVDAGEARPVATAPAKDIKPTPTPTPTQPTAKPTATQPVAKPTATSKRGSEYDER